MGFLFHKHCWMIVLIHKLIFSFIQPSFIELLLHTLSARSCTKPWDKCRQVDLVVIYPGSKRETQGAIVLGEHENPLQGCAAAPKTRWAHSRCSRFVKQAHAWVSSILNVITWTDPSTIWTTEFSGPSESRILNSSAYKWKEERAESPSHSSGIGAGLCPNEVQWLHGWNQLAECLVVFQEVTCFHEYQSSYFGLSDVGTWNRPRACKGRWFLAQFRAAMEGWGEVKGSLSRMSKLKAM